MCEPRQRSTRSSRTPGSRQQRWARHDIARPLTKLAERDATDAGPAPELLAFIELVCVTDQFRDWLGRVLGLKLGQRVTCELARYNTGD